jgi:uncharacterized membrane protein YesL
LVSLFSQDSALMRGLTRVADVMILNFLFIVTSVPVITLGASLTALNFTAMRIATGRCNSVSGDYFRSFRQNFRQGTIVGLILAMLAAVLAAWYIVVTNLAVEPLAELLLLAVWYGLALTFAMMALFAFPYLASFEGSTRQVLRNARLMSWKHSLTSLGALALIGLSVVVTVFYPHVTGYGLFWLLAGFGGIATANGFLFSRIFDKYIAAAAANQQT